MMSPLGVVCGIVETSAQRTDPSSVFEFTSPKARQYSCANVVDESASSNSFLSPSAGAGANSTRVIGSRSWVDDESDNGSDTARL